MDPMVVIDRATWLQAVEKWPELAACGTVGGFKIYISDGPSKIVKVEIKKEAPRE